MSRVFRCQASPASKPVLRKHRKRYAASHQHRLWNQGIGRFNRVYPLHYRSDTAGRAYLTFTEIRRVFEAANATPQEGYIFGTIACGESGGHLWRGYPGIIGIDAEVVPGSTSYGIGLVQNTPGAWGQAGIAIERMHQLGGETALRNPIINAVMAVFLKQVSRNGWGPWYGTYCFQDPGPGVKSALTAADRRWIRAGGMQRLRTR